MDLISTLDFHFHWWEDVSLCQRFWVFFRTDNTDFLFAFRTNQNEIHFTKISFSLQQNERGLVFYFRVGCKQYPFAIANRIRTIERRKTSYRIFTTNIHTNHSWLFQNKSPNNREQMFCLLIDYNTPDRIVNSFLKKSPLVW